MFDKFWKTFPEEYKLSLEKAEYTRLQSDHIKWYLDQGCVAKRVAVPKGGLVLWDSRQVHANANPIKGRAHPDR